MRVRHATDADWEAIAELRNRMSGNTFVCQPGLIEMDGGTLQRSLQGAIVRLVEDVGGQRRSLLGFMAGRRFLASEPPFAEIVYWIMDWTQPRPIVTTAARLLAKVSAEEARADGLVSATGIISPATPEALVFFKGLGEATSRVEGRDPVSGDPRQYRLEIPVDVVANRPP